MVDIQALLQQLTLEQKAAFTAGRDMWTVAGVPEFGIPDVSVTDGPNGARGSALLGAGRVSALCVPCGTGLAATWDPVLVEEVGAALGEEARTKSCRVLLAPTVNLVRHPLAGRTFESYSEDPLLAGTVAAGFIRGVQSRGVAATVKHFLGNEAEYERTTISSVIDERALRELYLVPFELAVRDGGVLAVMTSYNRVNGRWVSEDTTLLGILREFGFDGVVMTDWFAVGSAASLEAGLDLQMPGPDRFFGSPLVGQVKEDLLDRSATRWLELIDRLDAWSDVPTPEQAVKTDEHRALARRAASDATVLLKNDGLLPLPPGTSIALIGPNAVRAHVMGGGSAQLRAHRVTTITEALQGRLPVTVEQGCVIDKTVREIGIAFTTTFRDADGVEVGETIERDGRLLWFDSPIDGLDPERFSFTAKGSLAPQHSGAHVFTLMQAGRARVSFDGLVVLDGMSSRLPGGPGLFGLGSVEIAAEVVLDAGREVEVVIDYDSRGSFLLHGVKVGHQPPATADLMGRAVTAAAEAEVAVVVVGTSDEWETEGEDRTSLHLPGEQDELIRRVVAANPRTVVVLNSGAPVQLDWIDDVPAVLLPWLGGQEMADAVADVLLGDTEPAGRLPMTFPERIEHCPAYGSFPGANDEVVYSEGLLVGYRWYCTRHLPTRFCFGHGGSYTTFAWGSPVVEGDGISVEVTNTGSRRGAEVVQAYVSPPSGSRLFRPALELKGFDKLWLEPGQTAVARIPLPARAFSYWDPGSTETAFLQERLGEGSVVPADRGPLPRAEAGWQVDPGTYLIHLARSVEDIVATVPWVIS